MEERKKPALDAGVMDGGNVQIRFGRNGESERGMASRIMDKEKSPLKCGKETKREILQIDEIQKLEEYSLTKRDSKWRFAFL